MTTEYIVTVIHIHVIHPLVADNDSSVISALWISQISPDDALHMRIESVASIRVSSIYFKTRTPK